MDIFISGNLTDMTSVVNVFNEQVQPVLMKKAQEKYGQGVESVNFKWNKNNNSAELNKKKTMLAHLEAIDIAAPPTPMVFLLGEDVGDPLSKGIIEFAEREFSFEVENERCDLTELEIEFGAMRDDRFQKRALFCYINREDEEPTKEMQLLQKRIGKIVHPDQIVRFIDTEEGIVSEEEYLPFGAVVSNKLWKMLDSGRLQSDEETKDEAAHRLYMEKKATYFRSRQRLFNDCMKLVAAKTPLLFIKGKPGAGKSSVLSRMLVELRDGGVGYNVLPIFCALTEKVDTGIEVLQKIVYYLEKVLGKNHVNPESFDRWKDYEEQLCLEYENSKLPNLIIGIDSVDQLRLGRIAEELLFLPLNTYKKIQFVVCATPEFVIPSRLLHVPTIEFSSIEAEETREIIRCIFEQRKTQPVSKEVEDRLIEFSSGKGMLCLSLVVRALTISAALSDVEQNEQSPEDKSRTQLEIIDRLTAGHPDALLLCRRFFEFACERIDSGLYSSLRNLAASPHGFTLEILEKLDPKNFNTENFLVLKHYLSEMFISRPDGRYDFAHKVYRQSLFFVNLEYRPDDVEVSKNIYNILYDLEDTHPVRVSDILYFAHQCDYYVYFIDYTINAVWSANRQYRCQPIYRMFKEKIFCQKVIDNLHKYIKVFYERENRDKNRLENMVERLYRFAYAFGLLFSQSDFEQRDEIIERKTIYENLLVELDKEFFEVRQELVSNMDTVKIKPYPYFSYLREWYVLCSRYDRILREAKMFVPGMMSAVELHNYNVIKEDFLAPLSKEKVTYYDEIDEKIFKDRFLTAPYFVFGEIFRLWLQKGCKYDFSKLFRFVHNVADRYFVKVYETAVETICCWDTFDISKLEDCRELYETVCSRGEEIKCKILPWDQFADKIRKYKGVQSEDFVGDVFKEFSRRYRDLEYNESVEKYSSLCEYANTCISILSFENIERGIVCGRDTLSAIERALIFTKGRSNFIVSYFEFGALFRKHLDEAQNPFLLNEIDYVYERQFDFILKNEIQLPATVYRDLLLQKYPDTMQKLYERNGMIASVDRQRVWCSKTFEVAIKLLNEKADTFELSGDECLDEEELINTNNHDVGRAHYSAMSVVAIAVDSLNVLNCFITDEADKEAILNLYDVLEESVMNCFPNGSKFYFKSPLKGQIDELIRKNEYLEFTELLGRIDSAFKPW